MFVDGGGGDTSIKRFSHVYSSTDFLLPSNVLIF